MHRIYDVMTFILKNLFLRKTRVANLAYIIKVVTILLKQSLKTQEKLEELVIMYQNSVYIYIS